ncbi:putative actin cytoskeleton organization protein (Cro1) [Teratosphaeria destructans]|uniref:Actin cytoskeleton organization protein (Cro1) n=1 Tax=Teratosphaeria destructans TaxID=418781 RepID=A0A9W7STC0_9PEZI|nr:putative actin cytoskeleton organization protein (Cro1) [Teratosphaeria destructans]
MSESTNDERLTELLKLADEANNAGDLSRVGSILKEAMQLSPQNEDVRKRWLAMQGSGSEGTEALEAVRTYVRTGADDEGRRALQLLDQSGSKSMSPHAAAELLDLLLDGSNALEMQDQLTVTLLSRQIEARRYLATKLASNATQVFGKLLKVGDRTFSLVGTAMLDDALWESKDVQRKMQRDVFQLCVATLMEAGVERPAAVMKAIARQLTARPETIADLIDGDVFDVILEDLDIRSESHLRSQAVLSISKLLEVTKEKGEQLFVDFVIGRVKRQTNDDLIIAFSAAASVFPILPGVAARLFMTEGFVQQLVPNLERNSEAAAEGKRKSRKLEQAALELLSAACVDKSCRDAINRFCSDWLRDLTELREGESRALAALVLAKLSEQSADEMTAMLSDLVLNDSQGAQAIEGLAYTSLQPRVKEEICRNEALLKKMVATLETSTMAFGCLTVFSNLTTYRPVLSEEQKKMSQLKAYANVSQPTANDPSDDDQHVTVRCKKVLDVDTVPAITISCKQSASPAVVALAVRVLLSLSKEQKHRAKMAQQGAIKLLLQIRERIAKTDKSTAEAAVIERSASHALARLLISVNPAHVFTSGLPASSAVGALLPLLSTDSDSEQRDLLPTFEALLALTNLASMEDDTPRDLIIRSAFEQIEDLLFNSNPMIQRATVELVCNLMAAPACVAKFADGSNDSKRRLLILLALADVEDLATRRAAGGALAALTQLDVAVSAVLSAKDSKGIKALLGLCEDESEEVLHRGLVCILNLVSAPGEVGEKGKKIVKESGGVDVLRQSLKEVRTPAILQVGVEVLKKLV